jgi:mannose-6-phosphate isomerase-like protein (cupin superfamily)
MSGERAVSRPHQVAHVDEIEAIPGPGTLTWRPVRATLGLRAFGTNAYTASAGEDVIEPHTESPNLAHEELYFVFRGLARFTIDDDTFDAPPGTYVFVPDTASHRYAVAVEDGTTVLSFGGPATFTPSAWEWFFRADPLMESDPEAARAIIEDGLEHVPESPGLRFWLARLDARAGNREAAKEGLLFALETQPEVAELLDDADELAELREDPDVQRLLAD